MMNILITDKLPEKGIMILKAVVEFHVDCRFGIDAGELKRIIGDYDALIVRSRTHVGADIIEAGTQLKCIGRAGVGLDNVDCEAAQQRGIVVCNTPGGNTASTAEHTIALLLALSRNIVQACSSVRDGRWERSQCQGIELFGKTLGIIGLGRIGQRVAALAQAFGMKTIGCDPYVDQETAEKIAVGLKSFDDVLKEADFITLHVPKTPETTGLIGEKELAEMKPSARIINCARGGVVDEDALAAALNKGIIAGAAIDVFEVEPPPADHPLLSCEKCLVTPHVGAATQEARIHVAEEIAEKVRDVLMHRGE